MKHVKKSIPLALALFLGLAFFASSGRDAHAEWGWESIGLGSLPINLINPNTATIDLQKCDDGAAATWKKTSLTYSITSATGISQATVKAVRNGVLSWNNAGSPYNLTETTGKADITIEVVPVIGLLRLGGANVICASGAKGIESVQVKIGVSTLTPASIQNVSAHEAGHALGLSHAKVGGLRVDLMSENLSVLTGLLKPVCPSSLDIAALKAKVPTTSLAAKSWSTPKSC